MMTVTYTFRCNDCHETTDIHVLSNQDYEAPKCQHCGSSDTELEMDLP